MKKLIALISFLLLVTICSWSQELDNENFVITHGPWLQNMNQSGVTVIWTTNKPAVPGIIITNPDGTKRFIRNSHDGIIDGGGTLHKVRVEGLTPGSEYRYNLHSVQILKYQAYKVYYGDTLVTRSVNLSMPVLKSDKVSFTVFNDVHELSGKMGSYLRHNKTGNQDFWIFNGDMINYLQEEEQLFPGFIDTASAYFAASKPFYYVRGNHETRGYSIRELKKWFDFKDDKFYYSFDRGPVHFIILDSGEDKQDNSKSYFGLADYDDYRFKELEWLKEDVKSAAFQKAAYRIVMVHMPKLTSQTEQQIILSRC